MANRRMFSIRIVNSARFLKMPNEAQVLYFHLCMNADDDGVVEAYTVLKKIGVPSDNFRILVAKEYIVPINEDDVAYIVDWKEHNLIRADRKVDSIYKDLLVKIIPEQLVLLDAKPRADTGKKTAEKKMDAKWTPNGQHRLGKDRLGKDRKKDPPLLLKPWSLDDKLTEMEKIENSPLDIIATFIRKKKLRPDNPKALSNLIARHMKSAHAMSGAYTNEQIFEATNKVIEEQEGNQRRGKEVIDWHLGTVYKKLTK